MNDKIDQMITPDIKIAEMIIKHKSKNTDNSGRTKTRPRLYIGKIINPVIFGNAGYIVKMEGTFKGIGINNYPQHDDNCQSGDIQIPVPFCSDLHPPGMPGFYILYRFLFC